MPPRRGIGLRIKFNLVVLPLLALSLGVVMWVDYHHEVDAVMAAHTLHAGPVSLDASSGPVSPGTSPGEVAGRALRIHAAYGFVVFVALGGALDAAVMLFVIRPVRRIQETIEQMVRGHWRVTPAVTTHDEVGRLGADFSRLGFAIDALSGHLLQAERLATLALLARRLQGTVDPQVQRIGQALTALHAEPASARCPTALNEIAEATARIAAAVRALDEPFAGRGSRSPEEGVASLEANERAMSTAADR
jgi:HAMP domain-containing protein